MVAARFSPQPQPLFCPLVLLIGQSDCRVERRRKGVFWSTLFSRQFNFRKFIYHRRCGKSIDKTHRKQLEQRCRGEINIPRSARKRRENFKLIYDGEHQRRNAAGATQRKPSISPAKRFKREIRDSTLIPLVARGCFTNERETRHRLGSNGIKAPRGINHLRTFTPSRASVG